jgi:hypothetical protein
VHLAKLAVGAVAPVVEVTVSMIDEPIETI